MSTDPTAVPASGGEGTGLSPGARRFLALLLLLALWTATARLVDPVGEPFNAMPPGAADFYYPFNGARALLAGVNPYRHDRAELFDPWGRDEPIGGVMYRQFYPPSHLVLDIPLVLASGGDPRRAGRLHFALSLVCLVGLVVVVVALSARLGAAPSGDARALLAGGLTLALAVSTSATLCLERGQSDLVLSMCTWGGTLLFLRGAAAGAAFLLGVATVCKGYAVLASGGVLALLLLDARTRRGALLGAAGVALVFVAPVAELLPDGRVAAVFRSNMVWAVWLNHSFKNLVAYVHPPWADGGRVVLALLALLATALCFLAAWRAGRGAAAPGEDDGPAAAPRTLWTVLFVTCGLVTMIGWSSLSCSYNLLNVLPGVLVLGLAQERLAALTGLSRRSVAALLGAALACLFVARLGDALPLAAVGLVLVFTLGALGGVADLRRRSTPEPARA